MVSQRVSENDMKVTPIYRLSDHPGWWAKSFR